MNDEQFAELMGVMRGIQSEIGNAGCAIAILLFFILLFLAT